MTDKNTYIYFALKGGDIYDHVLNLTNTLFPKIDEINKLKEKYDLHSVLQFALEIDFNEEFNTPALGLDEKTIEFLYKTKTVVDVDIYRDDSTKM